jgi:hypothetical protein
MRYLACAFDFDGWIMAGRGAAEMISNINITLLILF